MNTFCCCFRSSFFIFLKILLKLILDLFSLSLQLMCYSCTLATSTRTLQKQLSSHFNVDFATATLTGMSICAGLRYTTPNDSRLLFHSSVGLLYLCRHAHQHHQSHHPHRSRPQGHLGPIVGTSSTTDLDIVVDLYLLYFAYSFSYEFENSIFI